MNNEYCFTFTEKDEQALKSAVLGTELIARAVHSHGPFADRFKLVTVLRVTGSQIIIRNDADTDDVHFWMKNGEQTPARGGHWDVRIFPITEARIAEKNRIEGIRAPTV